jgi:hypothetical protein
MTDKLQIRSEEYDIDIISNIEGIDDVMMAVDDGSAYVEFSLKKEHAVKMINHSIKVFDISRDEVNL